MDKEKDVFQTVSESNSITVSLDEYKQLINEMNKYKAQVEVLNNKPVQKEVVLEIEQNHVNPQPKQKKGFFD